MIKKALTSQKLINQTTSTSELCTASRNAGALKYFAEIQIAIYLFLPAATEFVERRSRDDSVRWRAYAELFYSYTCLHLAFAYGFLLVLATTQRSSLGESRASTKFILYYRRVTEKQENTLFHSIDQTTYLIRFQYPTPAPTDCTANGAYQKCGKKGSWSNFMMN